MPSLSDYERDDKTFPEDLLAGHAHARRVAAWLNRRWGLGVTVPPLRVRPDISLMREYADGGDMFTPDGRRLEAKQRRLHFTCAADYPFSTLIVDNCHAWDRAEQKPAAYVCTNEAVTHCAVVVTRDTRHAWRAATVYDAAKRRPRRVYLCPKRLCRFYEMN